MGGAVRSHYGFSDVELPSSGPSALSEQDYAPSRRLPEENKLYLYDHEITRPGTDHSFCRTPPSTSALIKIINLY
jgi:hypothetical protein